VWLWCGVAALVGLVAAWRGMQPAEREDGAGLDAVPDAMSEAVLDDAALPDSAVQPDAAGLLETAKPRFRLSRLRTPPSAARLDSQRSVLHLLAADHSQATVRPRSGYSWPGACRQAAARVAPVSGPVCLRNSCCRAWYRWSAPGTPAKCGSWWPAAHS
jgi:hypothetical protein